MVKPHTLCGMSTMVELNPHTMLLCALVIQILVDEELAILTLKLRQAVDAARAKLFYSNLRHPITEKTNALGLGNVCGK